MYRFRKKSDAQRSRPAPPPNNALPAIDTVLPPASDFRTSLILPTLTRRFTLLRTENGDRIPLQEVKDRLVQRRAQAVVQLTEEEEDLVLEVLGKARLEENRATAEQRQERSPPSDIATSVPSIPTSPTSPKSARSSNRSTNRRSNNLFGSHVDYPLPPRRSRPSTINTQGSGGGSDSHDAGGDLHQSLEASQLKRDSSTATSSLQTGVAVAARLLSEDWLGRSADLLSTSNSTNVYRVSLALEQVLNDIEGQGTTSDPTVFGMQIESTAASALHARSAAGVARTDSQRSQPSEDRRRSADEIFAQSPDHPPDHSWTSPNVYENARFAVPYSARPGSVSPPPVASDPAQRMPGYVPGMNRPITPRRDVDNKDQGRLTSASPVAVASSPSSNSPLCINDISKAGVQSDSSASLLGAGLAGNSLRPRGPEAMGQSLSHSHPGSAMRPDALNYSSGTVGLSDHSIDRGNSAVAAAAAARSATPSLPTTVARQSRRISVSPSPKHPSRRPSLSGNEELAHVPLSALSDAWSSGDEMPRMSRRQPVPTAIPSTLRSQGTPPPEGWQISVEADGPGRWIPSGSSSASSRVNHGRLALSSRFSTSSSSISLGSSYHSSSENLVRGGMEDRPASDWKDPPSRWDAAVSSEKTGRLENSTFVAGHDHYAAEYEDALKTLAISQQEVYAIQGRLLLTVDAVQPNRGLLGQAGDAKRPRRSSTPYSAKSALSGEDTEAGMATESTVTPKRNGPRSVDPALPSLTSSEQSTRAKLARNDAILAMLESLPTPNGPPVTPFGTPPNVASWGRLGEPGARVNQGAGLDKHSSSDWAGGSDRLLAVHPVSNSLLETIRTTNEPSKRRVAGPSGQSPSRNEDPLPRADSEHQAGTTYSFSQELPSTPKQAESSVDARKTTKRVHPQHSTSPPSLSTGSPGPVPAPGLPPSPSMTSIPQADRPMGFLRRLRNSVKGKPPVSSDDEHSRVFPKSPPLPSPFIPSALPSHTDQSGNDRDQDKDMQGLPTSPPAGQVGLKGFMARLRKSKREQEWGSEVSQASNSQRIRPHSPSSKTPQHVTKMFPRSPTVVNTRGRGVGSVAQSPLSSVGSPLPMPQLETVPPPASPASRPPGNDLLRKRGPGSGEIPEAIDDVRFSNPASWEAAEDGASGTGGSLRAVNIARRLQPHVVNTTSDNDQALKEPRACAMDARSQIIRRTLIFPENGTLSVEHIAAMRKSTAGHSRIGSSASDTSISRSIRDRAPTPPPRRALGTKDVGDVPPPMPHLGGGIDLPQSPLFVHQGQDLGFQQKFSAETEGTNKTSPTRSMDKMRGSTQLPREAGIELLELSNGQVIWSVVDGLRAGILDDNEEDDKSSFTSEFSTSPPSRDEPVQLFLRGHKRNESSRTGAAPLPSRRRVGTGDGLPRPETKVYFGSTGQISSLIDKISRGLESGSFNIIPNDPTSPFFEGQPTSPLVEGARGAAFDMHTQLPRNSGHGATFVSRGTLEASRHQSASAASSETKNWTMEEHLEVR